MIQINLLPGPKKKKKAGGAGFEMPNFGELMAKVKDPLLLGAIGAWVVVAAGVGFTYFARVRQVETVTAQKTQMERQAKQFSILIAQKKKSDSLRVKLEAEIAAIKMIDGDRYIWPHTLEEITKALPDYTWLVNVEFIKGAESTDTSNHAPPPVRFQIEGRTSDIEAYTRFVRQLSNSPWLTNIIVGAAQTVTESDRPVTAFTITATYREADMSYKRTVPVRETVR